MPEYDDEDDFGTEEEGRTITLNRAQIRALEKKAKLAEEYAEELAAYKAREVFTEAGFDLSDPEAVRFARTYEGELDVNQIRAAAAATGIWEVVDGNSTDEGSVDYELDESSVTGGGSMAQDLEDAASAATSQDDLNRRIENIYRAYGETVASDM